MPPVLLGVERPWEFSGGAPASTGWAGQSVTLIVTPTPSGRSRKGGASVSSENCTLTMRAEGLQCARLETRTKECNMRASRWVANP